MDQFVFSLLNINFWAIIKAFVLLGFLVYAIFAFVVVRQVKLMTEVVNGMMTVALRFVSWLFFLFSVIVFIFVLLFF